MPVIELCIEQVSGDCASLWGLSPQNSLSASSVLTTGLTHHAAVILAVIHIAFCCSTTLTFAPIPPQGEGASHCTTLALSLSLSSVFSSSFFFYLDSEWVSCQTIGGTRQSEVSRSLISLYLCGMHR